MKIIKHLFKIIGFVAGGVVAFLMLALLLLQTGFVKEHLKTIAIDMVRQNTLGSLRLGRIRGNLITGITLENVGFDVECRELFYAERIRVDYFLPALLTNTVSASQVTIEGMRGVLRKDVRGKWNVDKIVAPPVPQQSNIFVPANRGSRAWTVVVRRVRIERGIVEAIDESNGERQRVEDLSLLARFGLANQHGRDVVAVSLSDFHLRGVRPAITIAKLQGTVTIDGANITLNDVTIATPNSNGRVNGIMMVAERAAFDVEAEFPQVAFDDIRAFLPGIALQGAFSSRVSLKGPDTALNVVHRLDYGDLSMRNEARVNLPAAVLSLKSAVRNLKPNELLPRCGAGINVGQCPTGTLSCDLSADIRGRSIDTLRADVRLDVLPSKLNRTGISNALLIASFDGKRLTISSGTAVTSAGTLIFAGRGSVLGFLKPREDIDFSMEATLRGVDLAAFTGRQPLKSDLNLSLSAILEKTAKAPLQGGLTAGVTVAAAASSIYGIAISSTVVRAGYRDHTVTIAECSVTSGPAAVYVNGRLDLNGTIALKFAVNVEDLSRVGNFIPGLAGQGKLRASGMAGGSVRNPALTAAVRGDTLSYATVTAGSFAASIDVRNIGMSPSGNVDISVRELTLDGLSMRQAKVSAQGGDGKFVFKADIDRDSVRSYSVAGDVEARNAGGAGVRLNTFRVTADTVTWANVLPLAAEITKKGIMVRQFELANGEQNIRCLGWAGSSGPLDFDVAITSAEISDLSRIAGFSVGISGRLSASASIRGDTLSPAVTGQFVLGGGEMGAFSYDSLALNVNYRQKRLWLDLALDRGGQRLLAASGIIPVDLSFGAGGKRFSAAGLDIRLQSRRLNPEFMTAFFRDIEKANGEITLDARLSGAPARPDINGMLFIDNAMVRLASTGTEYDEINSRILIGSNTLTIERLTLKSGDGSANLRGKILFRDMVPYDGNLEFGCRKFKVMDTSQFSGTIDADLRFAGPRERGMLMGDVTLLESTINIPSQTRKQVPEIEIVESSATARAKILDTQHNPPPLLDNLLIDVGLNLPGNTWVKGQGANAELRGKARYRKDRGKPAFLIGKIETVRGTYELRGRLLKIDRGIVAFTGEERMNANLDAQASGRIADVQIMVLIGGTLDKPTISLKSEPQMDESEILSYLVFGKPGDRLNEEEGRLIRSTAIQMLGGVAARGLKEVLGKQFAPDVINIASSGEESSFAVGKYLTEKLFVRYEWRLGVEEVTQTIVDYQLDRHFSLHSQVGTERNSGVDLLWGFNY
jgi:autotransporter translocation and assembly factor TamB